MKMKPYDVRCEHMFFMGEDTHNAFADCGYEMDGDTHQKRIEEAKARMQQAAHNALVEYMKELQIVG
jgi:hypothetical protein